MQMLGGRQGANAPAGQDNPQGGGRQPQKPQQQQFSGGGPASAPQQGAMPDFDDDIPFAPVTLPFPNHAIHAL